MHGVFPPPKYRPYVHQFPPPPQPCVRFIAQSTSLPSVKVSPCAGTVLATLNHFYLLPACNTLLRCRRHSMGLGGRRCRRGAVWRGGCDRVSSRFCCTGRWRCSSRFRTHMVAKTRRFLLPTIWLLLVMLLLLVCGFCWSYLCCSGFGL